MDQGKIGVFIAQMRKEKKYTQRQLADLLGISDKTISKWECGNGLPEVSLMIPLCDALDIMATYLGLFGTGSPSVIAENRYFSMFLSIPVSGAFVGCLAGIAAGSLIRK